MSLKCLPIGHCQYSDSRCNVYLCCTIYCYSFLSCHTSFCGECRSIVHCQRTDRCATLAYSCFTLYSKCLLESCIDPIDTSEDRSSSRESAVYCCRGCYVQGIECSSFTGHILRGKIAYDLYVLVKLRVFGKRALTRAYFELSSFHSHGTRSISFDIHACVISGYRNRMTGIAKCYLFSSTVFCITPEFDITRIDVC